VKFTLIKDLKQDSLIKPILSGLLIFTLLYLVADVIVKHVTLGIFLTDIKYSLFGNEEEFLDPMLQATFLEFWHIEIFFIMMILLSLSAVYIRLSTMNIKNLVILNTTLLCAILSLIAIVLSYFVSESFVIVYVASFFVWHILSFYMALISLWNLHK